MWTDALPNTIREGQINNIRNIIESNGAMGMCTMDSILKKLLREGIITPMEAYMKASEKREFLGFLNNGSASGN
jgi:twitching motility protein PilT